METTSTPRLAELLQRKNVLLDVGERLRQLAVEARDPTSAQVLEDFLSRFRRTRFLVLVVGDFKSGKSTLVNALIGRKLCPVKATPRTAKVTRVSSTLEQGGGEEVEITYLKDRPPERVPLRTAHLEDLVAVNGASTDAVELIDVHINPGDTLLRHPLRLVDTPGLGSIEKEHSAITRDYVQHADVILFVFSASKPITEAERAFLLLNRSLSDRVLYVVNQIDRVEGEEDEVLEYVRDGLRREVLASGALAPVVLPVSGRRALESEADRAKSGLPELVTAIETHLAEKPFAGLLRTICNQQLQVCAALRDQTAMALGALETASKSADAFLPALESLRNELRKHADEQRSLRRAAEARVVELQTQIPALGQRLRQLVFEALSQWVHGCATEAVCKEHLPAFLAVTLTNIVENLDREVNSATVGISNAALGDLGRIFDSMEKRAKEVLSPATKFDPSSKGRVGRGVAALSGLSAFAEQMGGQQGGYGAATAALKTALGPSPEVRLLSIGAALSLIVAALGGPVSWLFAGVASVVATFFGWLHSSSWRERVIEGVMERVDAEVLPGVDRALQESLATFGATLSSEITDRSAAVLNRLLAVTDDVSREVLRVGAQRDAERRRLSAQGKQLEAIDAELARFRTGPGDVDSEGPT